jgi:hypothetical protein
VSQLLELAKSLQQKDPASLSELIALSGASAVSDFLDLAKLLMGKKDLERRIRSLPQAELENLKSGIVTPFLSENLLATEEVLTEAQALALQLDPAKEFTPAYDEHGPVLAVYETLLAITELLFVCERRILAVVKAGLRAPDQREIGLSLKLSPERLNLRFQLAQRAGLIGSAHGRWMATSKGHLWLEKDNAARYQELLSATWDLPDFELGPQELNQQISAQFPLRDRSLIATLKFSEILGLCENGTPTPQLSDPASSFVTDQLPVPTDKLVLQGDLSVTSLGPISAGLHRQLDMFADAEDLGLASRFRISALSLSHALECGMSIAEIKELLAGKGELPQPIQYLINQAESQFGSLRIVDIGTGTLIKSRDPIVLQQILNQQSLRPLLLSSQDDSLVSKLDSEVVYFTLRSEGYVAVLSDASGKVLSPRKTAPADETVKPDHLELATRLLGVDSVQAEGDDLTRQLQFAMRNKLSVGLRVRYPDGSEKEHLIEPLGLGGSRLRGRDQAKQAEITLPLSRVIAIWLT